MKIWLFAGLAALLVGCARPSSDGPGCLDEEPADLGRSCSGDGECGDWLVCVESACDLPAATAGDGGEPLRVTDRGEVLAELRVEIARGDLERQRGLGHRPCIEDGWGLLIEFPDLGDHLLQTDTMRFDLDIAMTGEDRIVHTVHRDARAGSGALYGAPEPTKWVLEVPAASIDLSRGVRLEF